MALGIYWSSHLKKIILVHGAMATPVFILMLFFFYNCVPKEESSTQKFSIFYEDEEVSSLDKYYLKGNSLSYYRICLFGKIFSEWFLKS